MTEKKKGAFIKGKFDDGLGDNVFVQSADDNKPGMSMEDRKFIDIMNHPLTRSELGQWEAPLPLPRKQRFFQTTERMPSVA